MRALEGTRILAISQYGAGPYATLHLADLGAEVIKIEDPQSGGDISRRVVPYAADGDSLYFQAFNRNKKSITLNLRHPEGHRILHLLVAQSQAVFNNLRGDVPDKLGLKYNALKKIRKDIVTCSLSGFGTTGSRASEPAYDYLMQALMGHMAITGEPDGPPEKFGLSVIDFSTGIMAALGLVVGLHRARVEGVGCDVDVSLFDTSASLLNYLAAWSLNKGYQATKTKHSAHPSLVPSQMFATSDGYLVVMCNKEKFFSILCEELGLPELAHDARFHSFHARLENKDILLPLLEEAFSAQPTGFWESRLSGKVPCAPVRTVPEALEDPLLEEREMIATMDHPDFGSVRTIGLPLKISGTQTTYTRAPSLGEHNEAIYGELLGMDSSERARLQSEGVI